MARSCIVILFISLTWYIKACPLRIDQSDERILSCRYIPLARVKSGYKVDVYGVVKFVKPPFKSRGSDYCITLSITDSSYAQPDQKLKCNLFAQDECKLPLVKVGDIIRFHRLKVSSFNGELQASNSPGLSWLIFTGWKDGPLEPRKSSSNSYTFTDNDKEIVKDLRDWIETQEDLQEKLIKLEDIAVGCYFDTVCQVVSTAVADPDVCILLRVWDGTQLIYETKKVDESTLTDVKVSNTLMKSAQHFLVNVFVFDDHFKSAQTVQPGDYVKFYNLHAVEMAPGDKSTYTLPGLPPIELQLHRGNSYGRSLTVISPDSSDLKSLKRKLKKKTIVTDSDSDEVHELSAKDSTQIGSNDIIVISDESSLELTGKESESVNKASTGKHGQIHDSQEPSTSGVQNRKTGQNKSKENTNKHHQGVLDSQKPSTSSVQNRKTGQNKSKENTNKHHQEVLDSQKPSTSSVQNRKTGQNKSKETTNKHHQDKLDSQKPSTSSVQTKQKIDEVLSVNEDRVSVDQAQDAGVMELSPDGEDQPASGVSRCMLQTASITLNHPHIKPTKIRDVLDHDVPYKFRIRAKIMDFYPKPTDIESFLKLYCPHCHYLCPLPQKDCNENDNSVSSQLQVGSTFNGVVHYNCPQCFTNRESLSDLDSPPHLQFIYMMRFLLKDDTGMLMANLWRSEAEVFFQNTDPSKLAQDSSYLTQVRDLLQQICPAEFDMDSNPWIECCVRSYSVADGTKYQIFDTTIV